MIVSIKFKQTYGDTYMFTEEIPEKKYTFVEVSNRKLEILLSNFLYSFCL